MLFDLLDGGFGTGEKNCGEAGTEIADDSKVGGTQISVVARHEDQQGALLDRPEAAAGHYRGLDLVVLASTRCCARSRFLPIPESSPTAVIARLTSMVAFIAGVSAERTARSTRQSPHRIWFYFCTIRQIMRSELAGPEHRFRVKLWYGTSREAYCCVLDRINSSCRAGAIPNQLGSVGVVSCSLPTSAEGRCCRRCTFRPAQMARPTRFAP